MLILDIATSNEIANRTRLGPNKAVRGYIVQERRLFARERVFMRWIKPLAAITCLVALTGAAPDVPYIAVIVADQGQILSRDTPIVTDVVNGRVPAATQYLHIVVEPKPVGTVSVRWSSPDGKNAFATGNLGMEKPVSIFETPLDSEVGVYPSGHVRGGATVVADIGAPVNSRATLYVDDEIGVGFGCYYFGAYGPSLRIVDGLPERTVLADADVAVVGPGGEVVSAPEYGCSGENYRPKAKSYHLIFRRGGRVFREHLPETFVKELPVDAIDETHPLDVLSRDGRISRLHLAGGDAFFTGWIEPIDDRGNPVQAIKPQ